MRRPEAPPAQGKLIEALGAAPRQLIERSATARRDATCTGTSCERGGKGKRFAPSERVAQLVKDGAER